MQGLEDRGGRIERAIVVRIASSEKDIGRCHAVMMELRPLLVEAGEFVEKVTVQQGEGFVLAYLEVGGEVVTVAGFRVRHMLTSGLTLYVDDLVTGAAFRSQGHGKTMLDWLIGYAKERGCATFSLDSGTHRQEAHAFYFREGMRVTAFHFGLPLES
jgi:GNAT superfamily N-acetyltransferase